MTIKRTWTVENTWICDSCQTKNLGRFMECQNCRSPKEKQEKDTVPSPDAAPAVTDPELLRLAQQKANWICEFCGGQVRDEHGKCVKNCGAPKPDEMRPEYDFTGGVRGKYASRGEVKIQSDDGRVKISVSGGASVSNIRVNGQQVVDADGKATPIGQWRPPPRPPVTSRPGAPEHERIPRFNLRPSRQTVTIGVVFAGVFGLAGLIVFLLMPWEVDTKVTSIEWRYQSDLRQRTTMHGSDWGAPSGAFNVSCSRKKYGTENCHPHQCNAHSVSYDCNCTSYECNCRKSCSDNGNGFSTCSESCSTCERCSTCSRTEYDTCYDQCDVFKDWCEYDYYEWPVVQTLKTGGAEHNEHWPVLEANGPEQRVDRAERYQVDFVNLKDPEQTWEYHPSSLVEFKLFEGRQSWHAKVNRLKIITPLQRNP